jgi:CHAD domain-containing protein
MRVALDVALPRLLADAGYRVQSSAPTQQRVHLYDSGDRRLAAAGAELTFNARTGWNWRREALGHPSLAAREWPAPPTAHVDLVTAWSRAYHRGRPLAARAVVTIHRRTHRVGDAKDNPLLTVDDERQDIQVAGRWVPRARRITVRAVSDRGAVANALAVVERSATEDVPTLAVLRPGLVRAPRLRLPDPLNTGASALFTRSATLSVIQWMYYDCEVTGGGAPDAVRKLRVALRRLRSDLQTFAPILDREWADGLRAQIGELAGRFGIVRDAQVLVSRIGSLISLLPQSEQAEATPLLDAAAEQLAAVHGELLGTLAGDGYIAALDSTIMAVNSPRWANDTEEDQPVTRLARRPWRRLRSFVSAVEESPQDHELHRIRILAKRARYAAEACAPAVGDAATASAQHLADLQTVLGELHDAVVTREWLRGQAAASAGVAYAAGQLAALELARLDISRGQWRKTWAAASRKQDWRWLHS